MKTTDFWRTIHGGYAERLEQALESIPADKRQQSIAEALSALAERERRSGLLSKVEQLSTGEIERLVG